VVGTPRETDIDPDAIGFLTMLPGASSGLSTAGDQYITAEDLPGGGGATAAFGAGLG
jgi:hypothetical protein